MRESLHEYSMSRLGSDAIRTQIKSSQRRIPCHYIQIKVCSINVWLINVSLVQVSFFKLNLKIGLVNIIVFDKTNLGICLGLRFFDKGFLIKSWFDKGLMV